jgi:hypothetical protein
MYATLYKKRYAGKGKTVANIDLVAEIAKKFHGALECGYSQGGEDVASGVDDIAFVKDGVCFALVLRWLRGKFDKEPDDAFHHWLFDDGHAKQRNAQMARWMEKQLFAFNIANKEIIKIHHDLMTQNAPEDEGVREAFVAAYPKADVAAFNNFVRTHQGKRGLDPSYDPGKYAGRHQRLRYDLGKSMTDYRFKQMEKRTKSLKVWEEVSRDGSPGSFVPQLEASKISKSATRGRRLSEEDRIIALKLKATYDPQLDEDGSVKGAEAAAVIAEAARRYQKKVANVDAFIMLHYSRHSVGVFLSESPFVGHGFLQFFDPNYGIFSFESGEMLSRAEKLEGFFALYSRMYPSLAELQIDIFARR